MIEKYKNIYRKAVKGHISFSTAAMVALLIGSAIPTLAQEVLVSEESSNSRANILFGVMVTGNNKEFVNDESVDGITGMTITGSGHHVTNNGDFNGITGIASSAKDTTIINNGTIIATTGISSSGSKTSIVNRGTVLGLNGISASGSENRVSNTGILASTTLAGLGKGAITLTGQNSYVENIMDLSDIRNPKFGVVLAAGAPGNGNVGISSSGNGSTVKNTAIVGAVNLDIANMDFSDIGLKEITDLLTSLEGTGTGVKASGDSVTISNESTGFLIGKTGIDFTGSNSKITNSATVITRAESGKGIAISGNNNNIRNNGTLTINGDNSIGIDVRGESNTISAEYGLGKTFKVTGKNAIGVNIAGNSKLENKGSTFTNSSIAASGENAIGVNLSGGALLENTGNINVDGLNSVGVNILENGVANNGKNITVKGENAIGVKLDHATSLLSNSGTISTEGLNNIGVLADKGSKFQNRGTISIKNNGTGILAADGSTVENRGNISVTANGTGILATGGSTVDNRGTITLSKNSADGIAIKAQGENSTGANNGIIKLDYMTGVPATEEAREALLNQILQSADGGEITNDGLIKDSKGNIIIAGGNNILNVYFGTDGLEVLGNSGYKITDLYKDQAVSVDKKLEITGTVMEGILNADGNVPAKDYLLIVNNSSGALDLKGTVNGANNGVSIGNGSTVNLNGSINAGENAVLLNGSSTLNSFGGIINGNIVGNGKADQSASINLGAAADERKTVVNGDIKLGAGNDKIDITGGSVITGNIDLGAGDDTINLAGESILDGNLTTGAGNDEVNITGGSIITGNIDLGAGDDTLNVDHLSDYLFALEQIIDGGTGANNLNIGASDDILIVNGTIKNFNINTDRNIYLGADASIINSSSALLGTEQAANENSSGNIKISKDNYLVLGVSKDEDGNHNHALTGISGNTITGEGTLYLDTRDLKVGKDGVSIDLHGTSIDLDKIKATQWLYKVNYSSDSGVQGDLATLDYGDHRLDIETVTDVKEVDIDSKYQDIWTSLFEADQLHLPANTILSGDAKDYQKLLYQAKERNAYSLAAKLAYDSIKSYEMGVERFNAQLTPQEWSVQAEVIGSYGKDDDVDAKFDTTGVLVAGEYGFDNTTSLGLTLGAGKQKGKYEDLSSELKSDSFYLGAYGKKNIDNFRFLAGLGYQLNKFKGDNNYSNGFDSFSNSSDFDSNGFNLFAKGVYSYDLEKGFRLEPNAAFSYNYLSQDSADEGSGDWALSVDSKEFSIFDFTLGMDLAKEFSFATGKGDLKLTLSHKISGGDLDKNLTGRFNGAETSDFTIDAYEISKNITTLGVSYDGEHTNGVFYGASYGYEFGDSFKNNRFTVGLGCKF